jgi:hypothetical protein
MIRVSIQELRLRISRARLNGLTRTILQREIENALRKKTQSQNLNCDTQTVAAAIIDSIKKAGS